MSSNLQKTEALSPRISEHILMAVTDPVVVLDHDLRIVWANEAGSAVHKLTFQDIHKQHCYQAFFNRSEACEDCPVLESFKTGKACTRELVDRISGDSWWELHTWPIPDENGGVACVVKYARDITERKRAEAGLAWEAEINKVIAGLCSALVSLASTEEISSLVLEHALRLTGSQCGYVGYMDPNTGFLVCPSVCGNLWQSRGSLDTGLVFEEFYGPWGWVLQNRKSLLTNRPEDYCENGSPPSDAVQRLLSVPAIMGHMLVGQVTVANARSDYAERDLVLVERLAAIYAIAIQRKQALEAVIRAKENWEKTFDAISDMVMLLDKEHRILLVNKAASKFLKTTKERLVGQKCYQLVHGLNRPAENCSLLQTSRTLMPYSREIAESRIGGTFICSTSPILDQAGSIVGYTTALKDITESKHLEAQLLHAEKMTAIGTLAGGIAHDFNNILQAISGYTQLLLMRKGGEDNDYPYLSQIDKSVQRAAELIQQLLLFSQKIESRLRPVDLNHEVENIKRLLERMIPKMIAIEARLKEGMRDINADPVQLEQIIMNIAINAKDAMPDGGKLVFETDDVALDAEYCKAHFSAKPGEYVMLSIRDTGIGMEKKTLERIFEPFYTTKEPSKGTGLGLAMVYGIVNSHGGHVTCQSEPGRGTTFRIYFPALPVESSDNWSQKMVSSETHGGNEAILLVDDDENLLDIGKNLLEQYGYAVITAESGEEALDIFRSGKSRVDLVVLDIGMPGMGGHKCMKELIKLDPEVKFIFASGYSADSDLRDAIELYSAFFIPKPYRLMDMLKKVREVLDS
ncbi:MAG: ATP-binding protein [Pseudomonadota bacterium]